MEQSRILLFPYPAPGHTQPFLRLATLLAGAGLHVVYVSTEYDYPRIVNLEALTTSFPTLHFETISDGMPVDRPRDLHDPIFYETFQNGIKPLFRQLLESFNGDSGTGTGTKSGRISCMIADVVTCGPMEVAEELGIPVINFCPCSARYFLLYFLIPRLVESGQIPYADGNPLAEISNLDSFEGGLLRRKDLPGFWDTNLVPEGFDSMAYVNETSAARRSSGLILNTFAELEAPFLSQLSSIFDKIYTIGPLHALSKSKLGKITSPSSIGGFLKSDQTCIPWLDSQPSRSVIFVSFGSSGKMKAKELTEFWHGLVNSGKPFLCVLRSNVLHDDEGGQLMKELVEEGKKKVNGIVVEWAPQEKVLNHPAVGGFLTHCGWNSVIESVTAGVPMICWPVIGDQFSNSIWIEKGWKVGLEIKDEWDRTTVETMVRALLEDSEGEMRRSIEKLSKWGNESVSEGRSSFQNIEILVQDIKKIAIK